jgi:hypothetical protein
MEMADVLAVFGTLLMLGIVFPGLLIAWWLLFPATVERARQRLVRMPRRCLWFGGVAAGLVSLPIIILLSVPAGPAQLTGSVLGLGTLAFAGLGAAGLADELGQRLARQSNGHLSPAGAFIRGAVVLELAAAFPAIGWFILIPIVTAAAFGAAVLALIRRGPKPAAQAVTGPVLTGS